MFTAILESTINLKIHHPITGLTNDSRQAKKGDLFIAMNGHYNDGHKFLNNVNKLSSQKLYFDHGTVGLDSLYENPQNEINKILLGSEINFIYEVHPDHDHEPKFFGQRFKNILLNFINN